MSPEQPHTTVSRSRPLAKWVGLTALTIFLGALGSGVWENLLKPLFRSASRWAFTLVTLGVEGFRDAIYAEVAQGLHEQSSLMALSLFFGGILGVTAAIAVVFMARRRLRAAVVARGQRLPRRLPLALWAYMFLVVGFVALEAFRITYINRAVTHFEQLIQADRPFLSDSKAIELRSRFAQIRTQREYVSVVAELERVATSHHVTYDHFDPY